MLNPSKLSYDSSFGGAKVQNISDSEIKAPVNKP